MSSLTLTPAQLTRAAGLCAVVGGLLFIGVQVNHPHLDVALVTTTEWKVRQNAKLLMAVLSLVGITGMYLRQVRQTGLLGLLGYVVFGAGYLMIAGSEVVGAYVLPSIADSSPVYVADVLATAMGGTVHGDVGAMKTLIAVGGVAYLAGGLLFGIALFRARILARWAAVLLSLGTLSTIAIPLLPQVNERVFAIPTGIALVGLGYSLWREQRTAAAAEPALLLAPR
jgi:hypothetical protein